MRQKKGINKYHTFMKRGQKGSPKILEPVLLEDQVKTEKKPVPVSWGKGVWGGGAGEDNPHEETRKTQSTRRKIS
jgi:hypothetical protein